MICYIAKSYYLPKIDTNHWQTVEVGTHETWKSYNKKCERFKRLNKVIKLKTDDLINTLQVPIS